MDGEAIRTLLGVGAESLPGIARLAYEDGEFVLREGEPCDGVYLLERGAVVVERGRREETGPPLILHSATPDAAEPVFFGEMAHFLGGGRTASVRVSGRTVVLKLPAEAIRQAFHRAPALAEKLFRRLARLLRETTDQLESAQRLFQAAPERLAVRQPTVLYEAGSPAGTLYQILMGQVVLTSPDGARRAVEGGDEPESFLNFDAYLSGGTNRSRAEAAAGALLLAYGPDSRLAVVRRFPEAVVALWTSTLSSLR
ncbi:MAG: cyclic nucleotide-binding domain-containing protein [Planctomycetes bacterium]|nr:cyclic nucleotide-binding domain-containing protein [Planctomycetota bacterium]